MGTGFSSIVAGVVVLVVAELSNACCGCPKSAAVAPEPPLPAAASGAPLTPNTAGAVVAVKTCPGPMIPAADGLVDDVEDNDNQVQKIAGRGGYWWAAKDDKGSTIEPLGLCRERRYSTHP